MCFLPSQKRGFELFKVFYVNILLKPGILIKMQKTRKRVRMQKTKEIREKFDKCKNPGFKKNVKILLIFSGKNANCPNFPDDVIDVVL